MTISGGAKDEITSARWQEATGKVLPTIGGCGETDVGGPAIEEAAHMESGNNSRTRGKSVRFYPMAGNICH